MSSDHRVYLGLGSNLNKPRRQLTRAAGHISRLPATRLIQSAPRYRTRAWGVTDQPDFINTVIVICTRLKPLALLKHIKTIEYRLMGRQHKQRWHSRCIDIDILYYEAHPFHRVQLQIPHKFMSQRCFVLRPLLDIQPKQLPRTVKRTLVLQKSCCRPMTPLISRLENNKMQQILD